MRRILIAAAAAMAASAPVQANELARVYDMALTNDTQLRAAQHAYDAAAEAQPQATAALLPQLSGRVYYGQGETDQTITGQPNRVVETEPHGYSATLNLSLYSHANWLTKSQASDRIKVAAAQLRSAQQELALRVTQAYFNVLAAQDSLRFSKAENTAVNRQLEQAQKRFEVGLSAITDVHEAQARYDLTVSQLLQAEQDLRNAKDALIEITGGSASDLAPLKAEFALGRPAPATVDEWIKAANENNLSLISSRLNVQIAKLDMKINRAGHYPTLGMQGTYSVDRGQSFFTEQEDQRVVVALDIPVYSGGATQSRVRQTRSIFQQRLAELEGTRRSVERQVRNAFQGVETGAARVKALKQAVVSNTTALEASETGLKVGARTAVDVLNAQRELYRAQRDYARARYDYLISVLQLKQAAGQLTETDLLQIDKLLVAS